MSPKTILIVEDEPTIQNVVSRYFKSAGFDVITASDGFIALEKFSQNKIDLICLDIMMPNIDGWTVTEMIRESSNVPIIIMTALSTEKDILSGYEHKIDDYITKPFNPQILVAKAKSLLNRISTSSTQSPNNSDSETLLKCGTIEIDLETIILKIDSKVTDVSKTEFDLISFLIKNKNSICSRKDILKEVWHENSVVDTRIIDTYIKKIRKILGPNSDMIKTVFGKGYRLEENN